jgi:hypothetical protein
MTPIGCALLAFGICLVLTLLVGRAGRNGRLHNSAERRALKQHDAEIRRKDKAKRGARRG